jgi:hypothetical protein
MKCWEMRLRLKLMKTNRRNHKVEWSADGFTNEIHFYSLKAVELESGSGVNFREINNTILMN